MNAYIFVNKFSKKIHPLKWIGQQYYNSQLKKLSQIFYLPNDIQDNNDVYLFTDEIEKIELSNEYKAYIINCITENKIITKLPNLYKYSFPAHLKDYVVEHFKQILTYNNISAENIKYNFIQYSI